MFTEIALAESINLFLKEKEKRSVHTAKNYKVDIKHFFLFMFGTEYGNVGIEEFNRKTDFYSLIHYFNELYDSETDGGERAFSNSTINRKQASIKSLLKDLRIKRVYHHDLSELDSIKNLPKDTRRIEGVSHTRAMAYAEWLGENEKFKAEEKRAIVKLAVDTGFRASELLRLKWNQFAVEEEHVIIEGYGKGYKRYSDKISLKFYEELKIMLQGNRELLFTLTYSDLATMMQRVKTALGDEERAISFHSFKKCSVTTAYRLTGDIKEAKRKGRHSNLATTDNYIESEEYGITGLVSLGGEIDSDYYESVSHEELIEAIKSMNNDFIFILNSKLKINKK